MALSLKIKGTSSEFSASILKILVPDNKKFKAEGLKSSETVNGASNVFFLIPNNEKNQVGGDGSAYVVRKNQMRRDRGK